MAVTGVSHSGLLIELGLIYNCHLRVVRTTAYLKAKMEVYGNIYRSGNILLKLNRFWYTWIYKTDQYQAAILSRAIIGKTSDNGIAFILWVDSVIYMALHWWANNDPRLYADKDPFPRK